METISCGNYVVVFFCLTEVCAFAFSSLSFFLIQTCGLRVEGEHEVSYGKRPCPEQASEPGYILEIRRLSLGLNSRLSPRLAEGLMCCRWRAGTWPLTFGLWLS